MHRSWRFVRVGVAGVVALVAWVPLATEQRPAGAAPTQSDDESTVVAVDNIGGLIGSVEAPADTQNLCVLATSVDGVSPAVRTATFGAPGVENAQFSIGTFAGRGLPEGAWNLRGLPCDGGTTTPPTPRFELDDVRVEGGLVTAGLQLTPTKAKASIEGNVVDADRKPVAGACITAVGDGPNKAGSAPTGPQGEYQLTGLAVGTYQMLAESCADDNRALRGTAVDGDGQPRAVEVTADGAEGVTLAMKPGRVVSGQLVDEQGGALSGVCLAAGDRSTRTDDGGEFELEGIAAEVGSVSVSTCGDGRGVIADRLTLPDGDDPVELDGQVITRAGVVEGTVTDGAGLPTPGVVVVARTEVDGPNLVSTVTTTAGDYRMVGVPAGEYVIVVNPNEVAGSPTAWSGNDGLVDKPDGATPLMVGIDSPIRVSGSLGEAPTTVDLEVSVSPDDDELAGAFITVDGVRRGDGASTVSLTPGNHLVQFADVAGWPTPDNQAVEISAENDDAKKLPADYGDRLVNLVGEVPLDSVPLTVNDLPIGTGEVSLTVPENLMVEVCAASCLPEERASDLEGRTLQPPSKKAPKGPGINVLAIGDETSLLPAEIEVDGDLRSLGRVTLPVDAGRHDIVFGDVPGYLTPLPHRLDLDANVTVPVVANYRRLAPVSIDSGSDDGPIWVDGDSVGAGKVSIGLYPGTRIVCASPDDEMRCVPIVAVADDPLDIPADRFGG